MTMSSKAQYKDYSKRLKGQLAEANEIIRKLTNRNKQLDSSNKGLKYNNQQLAEENRKLSKALEKSKRWYQILIFVR